MPPRLSFYVLGQLLGPIAMLAFLLTSLLGTLAQFGLAYAALRENVGNRAIPAVLLPLLPALLIQFIGIAPLLFAR